MPIKFMDAAWEDYLWFAQNDKAGLKRINLLIKEIQREPFSGIGKPEALRHNLAGYWSRRISDEHRLCYAVENDTLILLQCRFHY